MGLYEGISKASWPLNFSNFHFLPLVPPLDAAALHFLAHDSPTSPETFHLWVTLWQQAGIGITPKGQDPARAARASHLQINVGDMWEVTQEKKQHHLLAFCGKVARGGATWV